jgi:transcriptional regulator
VRNGYSSAAAEEVVHVQRKYAIRSMAEVRRVIREHGWAVLLTTWTDGLEAAHIPCLLDSDHDPGDDSAQLVLVGHTARVDPISAALTARNDVLLIFQGPNGYISPAWYGEDTSIATWNFTTVHVSGVPEPLQGDEAFSVLQRTMEHFEAARDSAWKLQGRTLEHAHRIARGTVPFRLRSMKVRAKAKLSQDMPPAIQARVIAALMKPGPYANPALASEMERMLGAGVHQQSNESRLNLDAL